MIQVRPAVTGWLKLVRASQPFNVVATSTVRWAMRRVGVRSDLVVRHLHRLGNVRCPLPNGNVLRLWSLADDWVSNQLYWKGLDGYEPETVTVFMQRAKKARTVLDVGAYVGFYSILASHVNPAARIYAFEPHPRNYSRLVRNVKLNNLLNVECIHAAAGDVEADGELFCGRGDLPTSSSLSADFMKVTGPLRPMKVQVVTLDEFVRRSHIEHVDLVKIDTESTEPAVLRGMQQTLSRDRPAIICEVLKGRGVERYLMGVLEPLGYRYHLLTARGPQPVASIEGHPRYWNYLFAFSDET